MSNTRRRNKHICIRLNDEEFEQVYATARNLGLCTSAYGRGAMLGGDPGENSRRRASVEKELLLRLLAEVAELRHRADEIARDMQQSGHPSEPRLAQMVQDYAAVRSAILMALIERRDLKLKPDTSDQPSKVKKGAA